MKLYKRILATIACSIALFSACDSDIAGIGSSIMPAQDSLSTFHGTFPLATRSELTGPVTANTSNCYLGSFIDPETNSITTCSFLAQFHLQEDYSLPDEKLVIKDADGKIVADSCIIRIFHDKYYGDSLATMKLTAYELGFDKIMEEGQTYYTDINPQDYINKTPVLKEPVSTTYTVIDQNLSASSTALSSGNYRSIPIQLGAEYGTYILRKYYEDPNHADFKNSWTFAHNVCPGFYIEHSGGIGALVNSDVSTLDVYFRYQENDTTITKAWMRLGATQEVIQNTNISHSNLASLFDGRGNAFDTNGQPMTYIKSPAGVHTEITLPIDSVAFGKYNESTGEYLHENDTINTARFTLRRYAAKEQERNLLTPPPYLLLIRKGDVEKFFESNKLPNNVTSFLCEYNSSHNAYTFSNVAPLITYLRHFRDSKSAEIVLNEEEQKKTPEEQRVLKWKKWEAANPDWNKVVLLPVTADYTNVQSYYGTTKTLIGIRNDYNLHSVRLEGGVYNEATNSYDGSVMLNVIYSRFEK